MTEQNAPQTQASPIAVNAQFVRDLSFEVPEGTASLYQVKEQPQLTIQVEVSAQPLGDNTHEVTLYLKGDAHTGDSVIYIIELAYTGVFTFNGIPEEQLHPIMFIECPRILFPFARNIIASTTMNAGFPPLMVQMIDFAKLYQQKMAA